MHVNGGDVEERRGPLASMGESRQQAKGESRLAVHKYIASHAIIYPMVRIHDYTLHAKLHLGRMAL